MKIFKVLSVMMIVALSAGFASCSNDDDKDATLVGTWAATYTEGWVKLTEYPNSSTNREWKGTWTEESDNSDGFKKVVFNEDNTGTITFDEEGMASTDPVTEVTKRITWSIKNNILDIQLVGEDDFENGDDYTEEMKVVDLTAATAIIEMRTSYPSEGGYSSYEKVTYTRVK